MFNLVHLVFTIKLTVGLWLKDLLVAIMILSLLYTGICFIIIYILLSLKVNLIEIHLVIRLWITHCYLYVQGVKGWEVTTAILQQCDQMERSFNNKFTATPVFLQYRVVIQKFFYYIVVFQHMSLFTLECYIIKRWYAYSAIHKAAGFMVPGRSMILPGTIPETPMSRQWSRQLEWPLAVDPTRKNDYWRLCE